MAILDTFTILFEADAKTLEQGLDDSRKQADRLNDELKKADQNADKATTSIGSALKAMAGLAAGFFAAGAAGATFSQTVEELNTIGRTADSLGLAAEDVDAFSRSMVAMGGDAQGARDSMVDMAESIGEAVQDVESGRAKVYATLGISLKDVNGQAITATEGMLRLSDAVSGMSREQAIFRIKELGITDNRTVELILKGRQEMERMLAVQKEQSGVTKESVENARRYQEAMSRLNNAQDSITTQMVSALVPALTTVIEWVAKGVEWMRANSQTVTAFFGAIAAVVAAVYLPAMVSAAAATLAATWPLILIGAVVTAAAAAFALLYDDIQNFLSGNDSLIGQISEKYPIVGETVKAVADGISAAWESVSGFISEVWDALQPLGEAFGGYFSAVGETIGIFLGVLDNAATKILKLLGIDMGGAFEGFGSIVGKVMDGVVAVIRGAVSYITGALDIAAKAISGIGSAVSTVAGWIGLGDDEEQATTNAAAGNAAIAQANASPLNATTSGAISNSVASTTRETNVQVGEVVVNTQATDANGIARDVGGSLEAQLGRLDTEYASGVDR